MDGFICLPLSPFILPLSPSLDAWHGSLSGWVHLPPFVSLHLSPVWHSSLRRSGWTGSFVSLCLICLPLSPSWMPGTPLHSLCLPSFVSRCLPAWMPGWTGSFVSLCLPHGSLGGRVHLPPFIWMPGTALGGRVHLSPFVSFVSRCLPAWMPGTALVEGLICLSLQLDAWHSSLNKRFICLACLPSFVSRCLPAWMPGTALRVHLFRFVPLDLSSVDAWLGGLPPGRVHLSPFVSLHLFPVVPGWLARLSGSTVAISPSLDLGRLSGWTGSFVSRPRVYVALICQIPTDGRRDSKKYGEAALAAH